MSYEENNAGYSNLKRLCELVESSEGRVELEFFHNYAKFDPQEKTLHITVDMNGEADAQEPADISMRDESELIARTVAYVESCFGCSKADLLERNIHTRESFAQSYSIDDEASSKTDIFFMATGRNHVPNVNCFSGTEISFKLGEGIIDFIYADFSSLTEWAERRVKDMDSDALRGQAHQITGDYPYMEDFCGYAYTTGIIWKAMYSSLYSAVCPPAFQLSGDAVESVRLYAQYLETLQKLYRELIEFCFDDDFYPELFKGITPHERYSLFMYLNGASPDTDRNEEFIVSPIMIDGLSMPYGLGADEMQNRTEAGFRTEEQTREFAEKYGIDPEELGFFFILPQYINVRYTFSSIESILELEFTKMLEYGVRFRKCKRCGRYFIMKGNYDTNYCDRIAPGETRNCQDLAAQENYRAKAAENPALAIYSKYYKRYAARVRSRQIKEADFKAWKYKAMVKRDQCTSGEITPEEYIEWLEGCFPNRKRKE